MSQPDLFAADDHAAAGPVEPAAEPTAEPTAEPAAEPAAEETNDAAALAERAGSLDELRALAAGCTACPLHADAEQTVFGEGPAAGVRLVLVGEQPGDVEDREGRPFVGPAGRLLDDALADAGIDRAEVYLTNAVKHFKWTPKPTRGAGYRGTGKRRIHQTPNRSEVKVCAPWLDAELALLRPDLVVALGATAAKALLGPSFKVTQQRGEVHDGPLGLATTATLHPSAILRTDDERRAEAYDGFVADLRAAAGRAVPAT